MLISTVIQLSRESLDFLSDILKCITGFYFCCGRFFIFFHGNKANELLALILACISSVIIQFSSVTHSCLTLCDPMDYSTPGLSVHHQLMELAQTHVHGVGDAIQPSHPLSSPFPPPLNLS